MKTKFVLYMFLAIFVSMVTYLGGCSDQYNNLKIDVNVTELEFDLDSTEENKTEATFTATVVGATGDVVSGLILELSDTNVATASVIGTNKNQYTIKVVAKGAGVSTLTIKAKESAKVRYDDFLITVNKAAQNVTNASQSFAVKRGGELKLSLEEMLRVVPQRIYPAVANFSILPTPTEVRSNADLSAEQKDKLACPSSSS